MREVCLQKVRAAVFERAPSSDYAINSLVRMIKAQISRRTAVSPAERRTPVPHSHLLLLRNLYAIATLAPDTHSLLGHRRDTPD